jgi:hypothetical protein
MPRRPTQIEKDLHRICIKSRLFQVLATLILTIVFVALAMLLLGIGLMARGGRKSACCGRGRTAAQDRERNGCIHCASKNDQNLGRDGSD